MAAAITPPLLVKVGDSYVQGGRFETLLQIKRTFDHDTQVDVRNRSQKGMVKLFNSGTVEPRTPMRSVPETRSCCSLSCCRSRSRSFAIRRAASITRRP